MEPKVWACRPPWSSLGEFNYIAIQGLDYSETVFGHCLEVVNDIPPLLQDGLPLPRGWANNEFLGALLSEWERRIIDFSKLSVPAVLRIEPPFDVALSIAEAEMLERYLRQRHLAGVLEETIQKLGEPRGFSAKQMKRLIPVARTRWSSLSTVFKRMLATVIAHRTDVLEATEFLDWVIGMPQENLRTVADMKRLLLGLKAA